MAKEHIFPLFLDADIKDVAATGSLPVDTSYVTLSPGSADVAYDLPDGTIPGQIMCIVAKTASDAVLTITTPFNSALKIVELDNIDEQITLMWNGSAWVMLAGQDPTLIRAS